MRSSEDRWTSDSVEPLSGDTIAEFMRGPAQPITREKDVADQRNAPCPCGSGKKYKRCCGMKRTRMSRWVLALGGGAVILASGLWFGKPLLSGDGGQAGGSQPPGPAPPGKVWSPEHGHWHDITPTATPPTSPQTSQQTSRPIPQPPGPAPEGKVWSPEHGHWHDINPRTVPDTATVTERPPGPAPPGKVWSAEHGHWHNDSSAPATADSAEAENE